MQLKKRALVAAFALTLALVGPAAQAADDIIVKMQTSMGLIELRLDPAHAPKTVENFLKYVDARFYDGTIFHRVIDGFMIQGGGFNAKMEQKRTNAPIINEARNTRPNVIGTIAMARTSDPHSATSQFFINLTNNDFLDAANARDGWGYAVFGRVIRGSEVVSKIATVKTGRYGYHSDVPLKPVIIESVRVVR